MQGEEPRKARVYNVEYRPLIDRDLTDRAIRFMKENAEAKKPFFIYLPYPSTATIKASAPDAIEAVHGP